MIGTKGAAEEAGLNQSMMVNMEKGLSSVCGNLTGDGTPTGGACDRKALGINLSTPILMMSMGVLGNLLALLVIYTANRQVRSKAFYPLLLAMAYSDLVGQAATGVVAVLVYANNLQWIGGQPMCVYHGFAMVFFAVNTPLLVCAMSVERLLALRFSYFYQRAFTPRVARMVVVGVMSFAVLFCACPLMGFGSYERQFPGSWCFLNFHKQSLTDVVYASVFSVLNIATIAIIVACNTTVVWTLLKLRRVRYNMRTSPSAQLVLHVRPRPRSGLKLEMETQMVWFLLAITVVFACLWLPINVHILVNQFRSTGSRPNYKQDLISVRLASINQIIDPWMYVILRKNTFFKVLSRIKRFLTDSDVVARASGDCAPCCRSGKTPHGGHIHKTTPRSLVSAAQRNVLRHLSGPRRASCPSAVGRNAFPRSRSRMDDVHCLVEEAALTTVVVVESGDGKDLHDLRYCHSSASDESSSGILQGLRLIFDSGSSAAANSRFLRVSSSATKEESKAASHHALSDSNKNHQRRDTHNAGVVLEVSETTARDETTDLNGETGPSAGSQSHSSTPCFQQIKLDEWVSEAESVLRVPGNKMDDVNDRLGDKDAKKPYPLPKSSQGVGSKAESYRGSDSLFPRSPCGSCGEISLLLNDEVVEVKLPLNLEHDRQFTDSVTDVRDSCPETQNLLHRDVLGHSDDDRTFNNYHFVVNIVDCHGKKLNLYYFQDQGTYREGDFAHQNAREERPSVSSDHPAEAASYTEDTSADERCREGRRRQDAR